MNVFGLDPYIGAILIASIGIGLATVVGWLSNEGVYNPRKVATSVLIGFPAAIIVVATELQVIVLPDDGGLTGLIVVAGLIAQIAGFDMLVKTGNKVIQKSRVKTS